ncbi:MAG TPA: toll/interleukin-1 receptor domain-containing protein [Woeseiaceae bacterium]|nr:toll/interleukin-1 receptor domain-containing protein [Woeseiaceae bacterium]
MLNCPANQLESDESESFEGADTAQRRLIFISHANPEDNAFTKWLAAQLAIAGYEVWCDLTDLLGGEKFWRDIPEAIDGYTFRFLFASTLESNRKAGTLRELEMAVKAEEDHAIKDFVIPLKVDAFPFASTQNRIRDRNFVRFDENWASGLAQLLDLLKREGAPKTNGDGADAVSAWHERTISQNRKIVISNEKCFSNWFSIDLPKQVHLHYTNASTSQLELAASLLKIPYRLHGGAVISFADADDIQKTLNDIARLKKTESICLADFINDGCDEWGIARFDAGNIISDLIRQAWDNKLQSMDLGYHTLASGLRAWYFKDGQLPKNKAFFSPPGGGKRTYRQLVGRKSKQTAEGVKVADGNWHFAVSASPQLFPFSRILLRYHVIFTDDGETPWDNADRMHKARRRVCKNWWNKEWRDRLFAMCAGLADGQDRLQLVVGHGTAIEMSMSPEVFTSPWTYFEDGMTGVDESDDIELVEDQAGEDESDGEGDQGEDDGGEHDA